jgi:hypothetical protein
VDAAHHHLHAPLPVGGGNLVGAAGGLGGHGDGGQVGAEIQVLLEVDLADDIVAQREVDVFGRQGGQRRNRETLQFVIYTGT